MSGHTDPRPLLQRVQSNVRTELAYLDKGCNTFGISVVMFRTAKYLFHVAVLLFTVYLIELGGVTPLVASGIAIVLIAGPEGVETYLVRQGVLAEADALDGEDSHDPR